MHPDVWFRDVIVDRIFSDPHRVTALIAPFGSGRSTVAEQIATVASESLAVGFIDLTYADSESDVWVAFRSALLDSRHRETNRSDLDEDARHDRAIVEHEDVLRSIGDVIEPTMLIVDGFTARFAWLQDPLIDLIESSSPHLRFVIVGSAAYGRRWSRLRHAGIVTELGLDDLALRDHRLQAICRRHSEALDNVEDLEALLANTRGWIGLAIAACRQRPGSDSSADAAVFVRSVLDELPAPTARALRLLCPYRFVCSDLAAAVVGEDSAEIVGHLTACGLLSEPDPAGRQRLPVALSEMLRAGDDLEPAAWLPGAEWCLQRGAYIEAFRSAVLAQAWTVAGDALARTLAQPHCPVEVCDAIADHPGVVPELGDVVIEIVRWYGHWLGHEGCLDVLESKGSATSPTARALRSAYEAWKIGDLMALEAAGGFDVPRTEPASAGGLLAFVAGLSTWLRTRDTRALSALRAAALSLPEATPIAMLAAKLAVAVSAEHASPELIERSRVRVPFPLGRGFDALISVAASASDATAGVGDLLERCDAVKSASPSPVWRLFADLELGTAGVDDRHRFCSLQATVEAFTQPSAAADAAFIAGFDLGGPRSAQHRIGQLTVAERRILRLLKSRLTMGEIGRELNLSVNTVKSHARSIYRKLDVTDRRAAINVADVAAVA